MVMLMDQAREDWERLASYVISARTAAGFATRGDLEAATGISARTLGKLETGHRVSPETLAAVARALRWTADSPARVLAGREPVSAGALTAVPDLPGLPDSGEVADEVIALLLRFHPDREYLAKIWAFPQQRAERLDVMRAWLHRDDPETGKARMSGPAS